MRTVLDMPQEAAATQSLSGASGHGTQRGCWELLLSGALAAGLLWIAQQQGVASADGRPPLFRIMTNIAMLSHFAIGDFFYWSRWPALSMPDKRRAVSLTAVGLFLFVLMRLAGRYRLALFYLYFLVHFWKDVDMGMGRTASGDAAPAARYLKWISGAIVSVAFAILTSGLVKDPAIVAGTIPVARGGAVVLAGLTLLTLSRGTPFGPYGATMLGLASGFLLLCAHVTVFHPARLLFQDFIALWHFVQWYVFYGSRLPPSQDRASQHTGSYAQQLKRSPGGMAMFVVVVHLFFTLIAWMGWAQPGWRWPAYALDYQYLYVAGLWTVLHITWNWPGKHVGGVRVGY